MTFYVVCVLVGLLGGWLASMPRKKTINVTVTARDPDRWIRDLNRMVEDKKGKQDV